MGVRLDGRPAKADTALLPDNYSCDSPDWDYVPGYLHYDTPQPLVCDNLLDFSHLTYVHENTLGGSTAIARARPTIENVPRGIRVTRHMPDVPPPPYYRKVRGFAANVDRWFIYDFVLPGTLLMDSGGRPAGDRGDDMGGARAAPQLPDGHARDRDRRTTSSSSRATRARATRSPKRCTGAWSAPSTKTGR